MTPVLVFDGDCAFCSTSARFVSERLRRSPADYAVEPWQRLDLDALGLTSLSSQFGGTVQAIERLNLDGLLALWHPSPVN